MKTFYDFLLEAPQPPTGGPPAPSPPAGLGSPPPGGAPPGGLMGGAPPPASPMGGAPPASPMGNPMGASPMGDPAAGAQGQAKTQKFKALNVFQALEKVLNKNGQNSSKMVNSKE